MRLAVFHNPSLPRLADVHAKDAFEPRHGNAVADAIALEVIPIIRADERERIAAMVEVLPKVATYRVNGQPFYRSQLPAEIATLIRRTT